MEANQDKLIDEVRSSYARHFKDQTTPSLKLNIALSGGCDSMVLLHTLKQLETELNLVLSATYINHGFSENAHQWQEFCASSCDELDIPFAAKSINVEKISELGIEGAARELRYQALASISLGVVTTAHHQNDQAETFILQLIRGAGLKGLAGMPEFDPSNNIWRPLLRVQRDDIEVFAKQMHIKYIEDESNKDVRFDRNFIRRDILPALYERFPHASKTIARSANLIAEGLHLHQSIAEEDSQKYFSKNFTRLNLGMMQDLGHERVTNLIRWWLEKNGHKMPSLKVMQQIIKQLETIKKDAQIDIQLSKEISVRAYKNELWLVPIQKDKESFEVYWQGQEEIILPDASTLIFKKQKGEGLSIKKLGDRLIRIQNRQGGERFKPFHNQPTRTLKYLLQKSELPPWERDVIPLLFIEDHLVAVPSFGIDHDYKANQHEDAYQIQWVR